MIPEINISDFSYNLPDARIAKFPLPRRDSSKLLLYSNGRIEDHIFSQLPSLLPDNAMMVFNRTKVVPARLHFRRISGAHIEVFCLEPYSPSDYVSNFAARTSCRWKCVVGNVKRWKENEQIFIMNPDDNSAVSQINLRAGLVERLGETSIIEFKWDTGAEFSEILDLCGNIPIPPYLNRQTQSIDLERYQTTYAQIRGSVAAPTAGLHFTPELIEAIRSRGINVANVCLHVGAGTFLPVKSSSISAHTMHREPFVVSVDFLRELSSVKKSSKPVIAVGTTSVRTLESLYWAGLQCKYTGQLHDIRQWEPYSDEIVRDTPVDEALDELILYAEKHGLSEISLGTRIIIVPGYRLRVVDILVTNFHQPQSTLLLLISAFVGDNWREIYAHALDGGYRFLSYGDSSVLFADSFRAR